MPPICLCLHFLLLHLPLLPLLRPGYTSSSLAYPTASSSSSWWCNGAQQFFLLQPIRPPSSFVLFLSDSWLLAHLEACCGCQKIGFGSLHWENASGPLCWLHDCFFQFSFPPWTCNFLLLSVVFLVFFFLSSFVPPSSFCSYMSKSHTTVTTVVCPSPLSSSVLPGGLQVIPARIRCCNEKIKFKLIFFFYFGKRLWLVGPLHLHSVFRLFYHLPIPHLMSCLSIPSLRPSICLRIEAQVQLYCPVFGEHVDVDAV